MGICTEESPLQVHWPKSEETWCRLLITMAGETFDIRKSQVNLRIMNLQSEYLEEENSKW